MILGVPHILEAIVKITMGPEAPPHPYMVSTLLGKYELLEVSVPLLDLPALLLLLEILEEMSRMSRSFNISSACHIAEFNTRVDLSHLFPTFSQCLLSPQLPRLPSYHWLLPPPLRIS